MKPHSSPRYSYREDVQVPAFRDDGVVVFMDGNCAVCSRAARTIARLDRRGEFQICVAESPLGQAIFRHYGIDPQDPESWLLLDAGYSFVSFDAVAHAATRLGGVLRLLGVLMALPRPARDWLYTRVARNRYRFMGRADLCAMPDPAVRRRLIA